MIEEPKRLGRGLAALLGASQDEFDASSVRAMQRRAPVEFLRPNAQNPRKAFDDSELEDLALSIRQRGIIQPIVVRKSSTLADTYEIIAGERRWRAAQKVGLHDVPIVVVEATDRETLELAIIENVQRADLNSLEEAAGYERLVQDYGYSQSDIAAAIGKSRSHIANMIRLTKLPDKSKALLRDGKISAGHARALLSVPDPDAVAESILQKGLTVRDVERLAQQETKKADNDAPPSVKEPVQAPDANIKALEKRLSDQLGLGVSLRGGAEGGTLVIVYKNLDQLDMICERLASGG